MIRRFFGCGCTIVMLLGICGVAAGIYLLTSAKGALDTPNNFLGALKDGNYTAAYGYFSANLKSEIGSAGSLQEKLANLHIASWNITGFSVQNSTGQVNGDVTFADGRKGTAFLTVRYINNSWQIVSFDITPVAQ